MAEYIDRQAVLDGMRQLPHEYKTNEQRARTGGIAACQMVAKYVPAADVRPVVRGKWEVVDWVEYDGHGECVHYPKEGLCCTNCKNVFEKKLIWKDNYCPNCGAHMRGGTKWLNLSTKNGS